MPTGIIINAASVLLGGIFGALVKNKLTADFKAQISLVFGVCSMGMGISSIGLMKNMPAVIFSLIIGTAIGLIIHLEKGINKGARLMQIPIAKLFKNQNNDMNEEEFLSVLVTIIVLFCASGTGIYGSLNAGMTGDNSILISKSILDFFTAAIFACNLGYVVSVISIPQFIIFCTLFYLARFIFPLTTPDMVDDFKACGGFLMIATGFRMAKIKMFPTADMIISMVIVMPLSWLWVNYILPFV